MNSQADRKIVLLLGLFLVCGYYFFSLFVADTLNQFSNKTILQDSLSSLQNAPAQLQALQLRLKQLEKKAGLNFKNDSISNQQYLLKTITHFAGENNCVVRNIPTVQYSEGEGFTMETYVFGIEGPYHALLRLVQLLEQQGRAGKLASLDFKAETDLRTGKRSLLMNVFIQKISKHVHEK